MRTTSQLRAVWAPACSGPFARVELHGEGLVSVRPAIVDAVQALNKVLKRWNYVTRKADTGAYNCRPITGGTGYSLHAYGIALDINWTTNAYTKGPIITDMPQGMVDEILAIRTNGGHQVWRWGGNYVTVKDAMHYEVVASPQELLTGIAESEEEFDVETKEMVRQLYEAFIGKIEDSEFGVPGPDFHNLAYPILAANATVAEVNTKMEKVLDSLSRIEKAIAGLKPGTEASFAELTAAIEALAETQEQNMTQLSAAAAVLAGE